MSRTTAVEGMLSLEALAEEVAQGRIDTIITALPDLFGRLIGKRINARFFLDEIAPVSYTHLTLPTTPYV